MMVKVRMDRDEVDHEDRYECAEPAVNNAGEEDEEGEVDEARERVLLEEEAVARDVEGQNLNSDSFDLSTIGRARRNELLSQRHRVVATHFVEGRRTRAQSHTKPTTQRERASSKT